MKKQIPSKEMQESTLLPEYGRKRLLTYADSFMQLARSFYGMSQPQEYGTASSRESHLWQKRLIENRELLADHLCEMSRIMTGLATESFILQPTEDRERYQIARELRRKNIYLHRLFSIKRENGHLEVAATMRIRISNPGEAEYSVPDIAGLLSVLLGVRLVAAAGSPYYLREELDTIIFEEETRYHVMTGVARAIKEGERISGDNYTFCEMGQGRFAAVLSDGMGSGEDACKGSELVVELFEQFLESGFSADCAAQLINGALLASADETKVSTLDSCYLDLYSGECGFMKVGAAGTYLKRDMMIEKIDAGNLPLGVFGQMEYTQTVRQLLDGEYVIMVSDGITDCYSSQTGEVLFEELLGTISMRDPNELAAAILRQAIYQNEGKVNDDMTVLVIGLWENE